MTKNKSIKWLVAMVVSGASFLVAAEVKPVWQLQVKMDGETSPMLKQLLKEGLGERAMEKISSGNTELLVSGLEVADTPERDWQCEIRGVKDVGKIMNGALAKEGEKLTIKEGEMDCEIWSVGGNTVKVVSPAKQPEQKIQRMRQLADGCWLNVWLDVDHCSKKMESAVGKLPKELEIRASGVEGEVTVQVRGTMEDQAKAMSAKEWMEALSGQIQGSDAWRELIPGGCECQVDGHQVTIEFKVDEAHMKEQLKKIQEELLQEMAM